MKNEVEGKKNACTHLAAINELLEIKRLFFLFANCDIVRGEQTCTQSPKVYH